MAVEDYANTINVVMWAEVVLAFIFITARIYTRHFIIYNVGWDDVMMIVNLVTFIGYVASISIGTTYGIGKKKMNVSPDTYPTAIMWEAIGQGICIMGIAASKASVALFLLRIVIFRWHKLVLWFCIVSTTVFCIITTVLLYMQCRPVAYLWDHSVKDGVCWLDFTRVGLTMGAWSAAMDFVLALLPWHVIMGLNMKRKEKLTVAFGLSLGIFAGICSVIRTYELQALSSLEEYIYDTVPMLLWSSTEVLVTIICACVPVLRPLYVVLKYGSQGDSSQGRHAYQLNEFSRNRRVARFNGVSSGGRSAGVRSSSGSGGADSSVKSGKVYAGMKAGRVKTTVKLGNENESEESFLRSQKNSTPIPGGFGDDYRITRTDEVQITSNVV